MRRIPELDALRGLAAVVILIYHLRLVKVMPILGSSVDLFFVLSGYLITAILLRDLGKPKALRNFFIRRSLRIWPIYYLALGGVLLLNRLMPIPHPTDALPFFMTYTPFIQEYWGGAIPPFPPSYGHVWTLAVEEQFYTLWPFLVALLGRRIGWAIAPLLVLGVVLRARGYNEGLLLTHADGLLLGAWLASREAKCEAGRVRVGAFAAMLLFGFGVPLWRAWVIGRLGQGVPGVSWETAFSALNPTRISLAYLGLVGLILAGAGGPWLKALRHPKLVEVGQISYGLYLYHPLVFWGVTTAYHRLGLRHTIWQESVWLDVLRISLSFGVAVLSWRWIERPLLGWKDRLAPREPSILRGPHHLSTVEAETKTAVGKGFPVRP